jgi:hypothetical protein
MKALSRSLISAAIIAAAGLSTAYADGGYNSSPDGFWYVGYGTGYQYTRFRTTALVDHTASPSFDPKMNSTSNAWLNNLFIRPPAKRFIKYDSPLSELLSNLVYGALGGAPVI